MWQQAEYRFGWHVSVCAQSFACPSTETLRVSMGQEPWRAGRCVCKCRCCYRKQLPGVACVASSVYAWSLHLVYCF